MVPAGAGRWMGEEGGCGQRQGLGGGRGGGLSGAGPMLGREPIMVQGGGGTRCGAVVLTAAGGGGGEHVRGCWRWCSRAAAASCRLFELGHSS